ncbi:class I SAM-dependent methyltransferase [Sneathiella sp. HT1-7]|uniref:class I SAM-dependent methyltransferase n=1 Tax=Sneathiella sp. HT1-7 TaxID=2887192 RepID=UPI001D146BE5|nr:class I SAM-dependent methyltransferase [Sneathiella sp. HT1-7]MCC3304564.1 class I SAM-dependent methyltransferase [Sneathiella sp. HT1-7]
MDISRDQIKEAVIAAGSDNEEFFHFPVVEDGLYLQQDPDEYSNFVHFMATELPPSKFALDIGVASGGQTKFLRDYYDIEKTVVLDIGQHPNFKHWDRIKKSVNTNIVLELIMDSHSKEARKALLPYQGQFDFTFIDGDHSYKGLMQDIELAKEVVKKGCIFVFHDTGAVPDCVRVFNELQKDPDFEMLANFDSRFGISVFRYLAVNGPKTGLRKKISKLFS